MPASALWYAVAPAAVNAGVAPLPQAGAFCAGAFVRRSASLNVGAARMRAVRQCQENLVAFVGGSGSPSNNHWSGPCKSVVSPRALEESMRPRLQSSACARPLNFTSKDFPVVSTVGGVLVR